MIAPYVVAFLVVFLVLGVLRYFGVEKEKHREENALPEAGLPRSHAEPSAEHVRPDDPDSNFPRSSISSFTRSPLWALRLSITTSCPGRRVGLRTHSM